jgi:hypothetical protein
MAVIYVARSSNASKWGASVGLTKHIYKLGVAEDSAEAAVKTLNESAHAGESDWKLIKKEDASGVTEEAAIERLAKKERMVDPNLYPKIKGVRGIFKVKTVNVENSMFVQQAMANMQTTDIKIKHPEIAAYLIHNALK